MRYGLSNMSDLQVISVYVISKSPIDYPGKFVVRRHMAVLGRTQPDKEPLGVVESLREARSIIPNGFICVPRDKNDEPQIYECWI